MNMQASGDILPDYEKINSKLNKSWTSANYAQIGIRLQITGERLAEAADFRPGSRILDVAAGNGNATLAFARRWCDVRSTDYVDDFLDHGRLRAETEGLDVEFQVADAQKLPFEDESFRWRGVDLRRHVCARSGESGIGNCTSVPVRRHGSH